MTDEMAEQSLTGSSPKKRNWLGLIFKITFCVAAVLLIIFAVMANIGGNSETLRKSIEDFITESTPYKANVGVLNGMTFFPDMAFDFEDTELYDENAYELSIVIRRVQVAFGFWDVMFNTGRMKALNIEGFWAGKETLIKPPFALDSVKILEAVDGPRLEGNGSIGETRYEFFSDMTSSGNGKGRKYYFGNERKFFMRLGDIEMKGLMRSGKSSGIVIENFELTDKGVQIMTGALGIVRNGNVLNFSGQLVMAETGSDITPDIDIVLPMGNAPFEMKGVIVSDIFNPADFAPGSRYDQLVRALETVFTVTPEDRLTPSLTIETAGQESSLPMEGWHVKAAVLKAP